MPWLLQDSTLAKLLNQLSPSAVYPRFYGSQRAGHRCADLCITHLMLMKQQERLAILFANSRQSQLYFLSQVFTAGLLVRSVRQVIDKSRRPRTPATRRQKSTTAIAGDRQQPRQELALLVPRFQTSQCADERFLRHVLGVLPVAEHAITQPEDLSAEALDQLNRCVLLSCKTTAD